MNDNIVIMAAVSVLVLGCSPAARAPNTDPAPAASAGGVGLGDPVGAPSGSASPVAAPAEIQSELVAVAELPYDLNLYAFEGALIGTALGADVDPQGGIPAGIIENDRYIEKRELYLPMWLGVVVGFGGKWPGVDLVMTGSTGRTGIALHYALSAESGWTRKLYQETTYFAGVAEVSGSTLAYQTYSVFPTMNPEVKTLRGPKLVRTPTPFDPKCKKEMSDAGWSPAHFPKTQMRPEAFGATKAGALVAIGSPACGDEPNGVAEVWAPGSTTSRIVPLPAGAKPRQGVYEAAVVRGAGDNDAYILYGDVLRFDGGTFSVLPQPERPLERVVVASGGALFGIIPAVGKWDAKQAKTIVEAEAQLVRFDGKAWARVPLPHPPAGLAATSDGTVWVSSAKTLLRSRRAPDEKSKVAVTAAGATTGAILPQKGVRKVPRQPGPLCPQNLVVLYGFTKVTPDDYDFPLTRKALKGQTQFDKARFVVAKDGGQKFFTAVVPDVAMGRKLVARIEKEVQGSKPQLVCAEPEIVREIKLDLKTGDVVP